MDDEFKYAVYDKNGKLVQRGVIKNDLGYTRRTGLIWYLLSQIRYQRKPEEDEIAQIDVGESKITGKLVKW
jgi:hypothetical protein